MIDLETLIEKSETLLFRCKTVFPFQLFPTIIEITESRIDIKYGIFFDTYQTVPVLIQNLMNVVVTTGAFFGSVEFEMKAPTYRPAAISYLKKNDVMKIKQIVTGLIQIKQEEIELSTSLTKRHLIRKIGASPTENLD
jgi:hypothetical protein